MAVFGHKFVTCNVQGVLFIIICCHCWCRFCNGEHIQEKFIQLDSECKTERKKEICECQLLVDFCLSLILRIVQEYGICQDCVGIKKLILIHLTVDDISFTTSAG